MRESGRLKRPCGASRRLEAREFIHVSFTNIDVDIPLHKIVGIAGVSGSGKSSLALGVLYAEGSRRYLESLSTYTRRRMTQAARAHVDDVRYVPAALALHQRPGGGTEGGRIVASGTPEEIRKCAESLTGQFL